MALELMQGNKCAMTDESLWEEHYVLKDVNRFTTESHVFRMPGITAVEERRRSVSIYGKGHRTGLLHIENHIICNS